MRSKGTIINIIIIFFTLILMGFIIWGVANDIFMDHDEKRNEMIKKSIEKK